MGMAETAAAKSEPIMTDFILSVPLILSVAKPRASLCLKYVPQTPYIAVLQRKAATLLQPYHDQCRIWKAVRGWRSADHRSYSGVVCTLRTLSTANCPFAPRAQGVPSCGQYRPSNQCRRDVTRPQAPRN